MGKARLVDKDLGFRALMERAKQIRERKVKVGVLASGRGAAHHAGSDLTKAEIAAILEYGTRDGHIKPRPAFRITFDRLKERYAKVGGDLLQQVLLLGFPLERALGILGAMYSADVKKTITVGPGVPPPNAPATIRAKGSSRPWVDTGAVVGAITWAVMPASGDGSSKEEDE